MRDTLARLRQQLGDTTDRFFAPREVLLRTDGRVAYFRLGRRQQKLAVLAILGVVAWAILGTAGFLINQSRVGSRDHEIARLGDLDARNRELQLRIASVRIEVGALEAAHLRVGTLTADLYAAGAEIERLRQDLDATRRRMALIVDDRTNLRAAREDLAADLVVLKAHMAALLGEQQRISEKLTDRMQVSLDGIERALATTALDVDSLLAQAALRLAAGDGPSIALRARYQPERRQLPSGVATLIGEIDRFEQLQHLLRSLPLASPLDSYSIESGFGMRNDPLTRLPAMHEGIDLANELNTPVLSTAPGVVVYAGWKGDFGRLIEIDHGLGISTRYGHLRSISVKLGQQVDYRHEIGKVGSSGRSTGPHVHYEVRVNGKPYDPANFLEAGRFVFQGIAPEIRRRGVEGKGTRRVIQP